MGLGSGDPSVRAPQSLSSPLPAFKPLPSVAPFLAPLFHPSPPNKKHFNLNLICTPPFRVQLPGCSFLGVPRALYEAMRAAGCRLVPHEGGWAPERRELGDRTNLARSLEYPRVAFSLYKSPGLGERREVGLRVNLSGGEGGNGCNNSRTFYIRVSAGETPGFPSQPGNI